MQLFIPDRRLPATRILFDTSQMLPRLQQLLNHSGDLSLSISGIRYKPETSCVVDYRIRLDGVDSYCHAKAFGNEDWPIRKKKLVNFEPDVLLDDDHAFALFKFPLDTELPAIRTLTTDPQAFLSRVFFTRFSEQIPRAMLPLAYKPNRRYTLRVDTESGDRFVLKLHDPSTFGQALESAKALKESRFGIATVRVGRSQRHQALIFRWLEGNEIDFSRLDSNQIESTLESIFGYLDRLQASAIPSTLSISGAGAADEAESMASYLALIYPPSATRAKAIAESILGNRFNSGRPSFVHGDFHERQVIESEGEIRACDFDNCGAGENTSDIANFVAHLHLRTCQGDLSHSAVEFVDECVSRRIGREDLTSLERYRCNRIDALFRLATHPFRKGSEDWPVQIDQILDQLEQLIHDEPSNRRKLIKVCKRSPEPGEVIENHVDRESESQGQVLLRALREDQRLSFLCPLFDPKVAQEAIEKNASGVSEFLGDFEVRDVVARRLKPGRRCVVEFVLSTAHGIKSILGKASAKRLDRRTHDVQSTLFHELGFGQECRDELMVPRPLGQLEPWNMWLQEKVPAVSAGQYFQTGQLGDITGQLAATIAKLHNCNLIPDRTHRVSDELQILHERLSRVAAERPDDSSRIQRILKSCTEIAKLIDDTKTSPIHRDFYQEQILISGTKTWLVDLDLVTFGHPALDVGNFLAHLTEHGIRRHGNAGHWIQHAAEFMQQYLSRMPNVQIVEIESYEAISLARHIFISWSRPDRKDIIEKIIDVTERKIDSLIHNPKLLTPSVLLQPCLEY